MRFRPYGLARLLVLSAALAVVGSATAQVYPFRVLTSADGLPHPFCYSVTQDRWGWLWVGTFGGAARFDGLSFTAMRQDEGLPGNNVRAILEDSRGRLWFAVNGGVARFERGEAGRLLTEGRSLRIWTRKDGLPASYGLALVEDPSAGMWVATRDGGFSLITDKGVTKSFLSGRELPSATPWCAARDGDGSLWVGTRGGGAARITGDTVTVYSVAQGLPDPNVFDLELSPQGVLHAATSRGVARWNSAAGRFEALDYGPDSGAPTSSVAFDSRGVLWVGRYGAGLAKVPSEGPATVFNEDNGLVNGYVTGLYVDREDSLWITTQGAGVVRFSSDRFAAYDRGSGWPGGAVASGFAEEAGGAIWVASFGKGAIRIEGRRVTRVGTADGLPDELIRALVIARDGSIYMGSNNGCSVRPRGEARFRPLALPGPAASAYVNGFAETADGTIWMSTFSGLVSRSPSGAMRLFTKADGLLENELESINVGRDGRVFAGSVSGVSVWDGSSFTHLTPADSGIPRGRVFNVVSGLDGSTWFGGDGGIARVRADASGRFPRSGWTHYGLADGLPAAEVTALAVGRDGAVWAGTGSGVARFDGQRFQRRGGREEMPSSEVLNRAVLVDSRGRVWWGTPAGPVVYMPWNDRINVTPPPVLVTDVVAGSESLGPVRRVSPATSSTGLTFRFVGLSFENPERVLFRTRLVGLDGTWSAPAPVREARFTYLPAGAFRFEVQAANNDGVWSRQPAGVDVIVPSPWWKRPSAVAVLMLLLFGTAYLAYDLRVTGIKRRAHELETLVAERTEELREEARRTRALLDSMSEAVLFLEPSLKVRLMNPAAQRLLDDTNALDTLLRSPDLRSALGRVSRDGETAVLRLDVGGRTLQLHAAPVVLRPRAEQGIVVVANDVTQLLELDRMKSEFVALVSHELRAPLTSIKGSLEMLRDGLAGEVSARALELVRVAHRNSERLGRLINDILDLEKLESEGMEFRMHRQELLPLLRAAVESSHGMAETLGVKLEIGRVDACRVDVDGDRLVQVLTNLVSNALRFSPQGETVTVSAVRSEAGVRVSVVDHGPGVPEEFQPRIFRKFAQAARGGGERKRGGTGLGLAISKAFVEKMGGQIGFASVPGRGATFYFDLPEGDGRRSSGELPRIRTTQAPLG